MAAKKIPQILVGSSVMANLFGVSTRRVQQLTSEGIITATKAGKVNQYNLYEVAREYFKYLGEKLTGRDAQRDTETEQRKLTADARLKESRADVAELELAELKGNMHRSEDVQAAFTDLVFFVRGALVALPGRLAPDTHKAGTVAEAAVVIQREVNQLLNQLADYQYDPEVYTQRVRERQGWDQNNADEADE